MLKVPDLPDAGEFPDPDLPYRAHPLVRPAEHFLAVGGTVGGADGGRRPTDPRLRAIRQRNAASDDASVRNPLTDLPAGGREFEKRLAGLAPAEAAGIGRTAEEFLRGQERELAASLANDSQRRLFAHAFGAFSAALLGRADAIRDAQTKAFLAEVCERQNRAFLDLALRPESLFDDRIQTVYRDMCLLNVDNLSADLPEAERNARLDAAQREFCREILDRRLELDPARMRSMLDAPAIRRVLGGEALAGYEEKAAAAMREDERRAAAAGWLAEGLDPAGARRAAGERFPDPDARRRALGFYREIREREGREALTGEILEMDRTWREVKSGRAGDNPRLDALRRSDPELAAFMEERLAAWRAAGGRPAGADLAYLLELTDDFDPGEAIEALRGRDALFELFRRLGEATGPECSLYLRLVSGKSTPEDAGRLADLRLARVVMRAAEAEEKEPGENSLAEYLACFSDSLRIRTARAGGELDRSEKLEVAREFLSVPAAGIMARRPGAER